jgi:hypothetical protein
MGDVEGLLNERPLILRSTTRKVFQAAKPTGKAEKRLKKKQKALRKLAEQQRALEGALILMQTLVTLAVSDN